MLVSALILFGTRMARTTVYIAKSTDKIEVKLYQFDADSHYSFESAVEDDIENIVPQGKLCIVGDMEIVGEENGVNKDDVNKEKLKITYVNGKN